MRKLFLAALFLLPVLILFPHLNEFPFQPGATYSDLLVTHYPNTLYLQRSLAEWKTIPLWSPTILSGYPFTANPLSGLFYLPGWLAVLIVLPLGINLTILLHLILGGIGMYRFLRAEGLSEAAALLGGLTFEALPKLFGHLGAGHITLIYAVAWTPWLLYAERREWNRPAERLLPGVVLGMITLADVRWAAYAGGMWVAYGGWNCLHGLRFRRHASPEPIIPGPEARGVANPALRGSSLLKQAIRKFVYFFQPAFSRLEPRSAAASAPREDATEIGIHSPAGEIRNHFASGLQTIQVAGRWFAQTLSNLLLALLIAAPLLLPLAQYTSLSTRNKLMPQDNLILSLPPGQLFGLIYPTIGGSAEWVLYPGAVTLALAVYVLSKSSARRKAAFWLIAIAVTLVFALGSYLPPLAWISRLLGMSLLRVPPRALFLTGFCFAFVAAVGLDTLLAELASRSPSPRDRSGLVVFAVSAFAALFAAAAWLVVNRPLPRIQFAWGAAFLLVGAAVILLARARRLSPTTLTVLALAISLVDLIGVNGLSLDFRPQAAVFSAGSAAAEYLSSQETGTAFRVYSPSYSLPQHVAAFDRLELADGVDPLQSSAYREYMRAATGVPFTGYSVTLPPFANADPAEDNAGYLPDAARLGLLNVKYLVSAFPLDDDGLVLLARFGETRVYQNELARPRAWVQSPDAPPGQGIQSEPALVERPNSIQLKAKGPGLLVLAELAYPGWQVAVDGKPAPVETVGGLLRSVRLDAGEHEVVFQFRPVLVYAGLALATLTWASLIYFTWGRGWPFRRGRERRDG